jgi:PAS domain S-box-containing protein
MENHKRNNICSIPLPKRGISNIQKGNSEATLQHPDILRQTAVPIDLPLTVKQDSSCEKYETLLQQIDDLLAESVEHSNRVLSETQVDYLIMSQIFNASNNGIWALNKERVILRINRMLLNLLGKPIEEVVGKKCYEIFIDCEANLAGGECKGARLFGGEVLAERQATMTLADGERIPIVIVATPLTGLDGSTIGMVETFIDISNRMKIVDKLPEAKLMKI